MELYGQHFYDKEFSQNVAGKRAAVKIGASKSRQRVSVIHKQT